MPISLQATCNLPTEHGELLLHVFAREDGQEEVVAAVHRTGDDPVTPLVRIHSACFTGDVLGSLRCDCRAQLSAALRLVLAEPYGILLYLVRHEGRGVGLVNKIRAYALQEQGRNTVEANEDLGLPADARDYAAAVVALRRLDVAAVRLATNNPRKLQALRDAGLDVERVPLGGFLTGYNAEYLRVKDEVLGHLNSLPPHH